MENCTTPLAETAPGGQHVTDVAIIGAGPVGLFAVFQCGMLGMACHVLDALEVVGGQCAALYPEKPIYDIPAVPEISGRGLVDQLMMQAAPFNPSYHLGQQVSGLTENPDGGWRLETSAGTVIDAKAVIIAAGVGAFQPKRPPLPGLAAFEGLAEGGGVHYAIHDPAAYRGKRVVIAGGGDSAIDWALVLAEVASIVHVVHRRDKFRAADSVVAELRRLADAGNINLVIPYQLKSLSGAGGQLTEVVVADTAGNEKSLPADVLLPFYGLSQKLGPIAEWGLGIDAGRITIDPATSMTNQNGIFAVGDVSTYPGKLKLILSGFAEAASAAHAAHGVVYPDRHLKFEYSTTKGLPDAP
jgi:thioredoxin reductase (NADPH)